MPNGDRQTLRCGSEGWSGRVKGKIEVLTIVLQTTIRGLRKSGPERDLISVTQDLHLALADLLAVDLEGDEEGNVVGRVWLLTKVPLLDKSVTLIADLGVSSPSHSMMQWWLPISAR